MKVLIRKKGSVSLTESLNVAKNTNECLVCHIFADTKDGYSFASNAETLTKMMYRTSDPYRYQWSQKAIQFVLQAEVLGLVGEIHASGFKWFFIDISSETLGLAKFAGVPFGESQIGRLLGISPVIAEFRDVLPTEMISVEEYGNRFNGGYTYHPTEKFAPITVTDAVGVRYNIVHIPNSVSGGYGVGYKGGFKNQPI